MDKIQALAATKTLHGPKYLDPPMPPMNTPPIGSITTPLTCEISASEKCGLEGEIRVSHISQKREIWGTHSFATA